MASEIALQIQTGYESGGLDKATKDVKKFGDTAEDAGNRSSKSMEGLFKRLERPIGMIAFQGLADSLTNMGQKGQTATMMVERGLHAAGIALLYFNPLLGMAVIASTALYEAFNKVEGAAGAEGDAIAKAADEASKAADQSDKYTAALLKQGKLTQEQANQLALMHHESMDTTKDAKEATAEQLKYAESLLKAVSAGKFLAGGYREMKDSMMGVAHAQQMVNDALDKFNQANGPDAVDKKAKKEPKEDNAWMTEKRVAQEKLAASTMTLSQLEARTTELRKKLTQDDMAMSKATTKAQVTDIQTQINETQRLLSIDTEATTKLDENNKKKTEGYRKMGESMQKMTETLVSGLIEGGKAGVKAMQQLASDILKIAAEQATTQLQIAATRDLANPATVGIGLAEEAAIGAINGLAGGIGAAISGGGGTPSSSGATGQNNVTTPQAGGGSSQQQSNLTVYVQGGVIDDNFAQNLLKRLNDQVTQNGGSYAMPNINYAGAN